MGRYLRGLGVAGVVVVTAIAAPGCTSSPDPSTSEPDADATRPGVPIGADRAKPARLAPAGRALRTAELLPMPLDKVLWYRASFPSADPSVPPREVAFFTVRDPEVGRFLEAVGLGESRMRLIRRRKQVWLVPSSTGRSSLVEPTVIFEQGEATRLEPLLTAMGRVTTHRVDRREKSLEATFWFGRDLGLVKQEISSKGAPVFRLELLAVLPRGRPPSDYDCTSPDRMWNALQEAIRRLDVDSLPAFFTRKLAARLGGPDWQATSRMAQALRRTRQVDAERIRRLLPDLLDVRLKVTGSWRVKGNRAEADARLEARLGRKLQVGQAVIELERNADGRWCWDGFRKSETPGTLPTPPGAEKKKR